ncbi:hypothetical protein [Staphylococcus nepalensis]|uniref:hypothetical protein n=1 Tax=Staphylococcus nepalensis TaxID=214473 RepID=UPI001F53F5BA|nr:hypothetical protein [Staphylococcus nepalensis]
MGEWIDGGGSLVIDGYHVDIIFRDIEKLRQVINESLEGNVSIHYQTGRPPWLFKCYVYGRTVHITNFIRF